MNAMKLLLTIICICSFTFANKAIAQSEKAKGKVKKEQVKGKDKATEAQQKAEEKAKEKVQ